MHFFNIFLTHFFYRENMSHFLCVMFLCVSTQKPAQLNWYLLHAVIVLRTLTGHKAGIRSLDFHPSGEYAASGSMDCNVKVCVLSVMLLSIPMLVC